MIKPSNEISLKKKYILSNKKLKLIQIILNFIGIYLLCFSLATKYILAFLFIGSLVGMNYFLSKYRKTNYETFYIREKLLMLLHTNSLYTVNTDSNNNTIIQRSAVLSFVVTDKYIIVRAHVTGDSFSKKMLELDVFLSGAIGLELEEKKELPTHVDYYFIKHKEQIKQFTFSNELNQLFFSNIPLEVIILTNKHRFSLKKNTNLGIFGRTGAGKTIALQWYLYNAVAKGCGVAPNTHLSIVDGKGADLFSLGELLKDELGEQVSVGQSPTALAKLSREFVEVMNARFEIIKNSNSLNADAYDLKMIPNFLFVDELASIRDSCGISKQGKELWNEILQNLSLIARKGRQAGCHLCISTQDPNAENIPVELRNQISCVLYLGNPSTDRVKMAFAMCELKNIPVISDRKGEALFYADGNNMIEPEITIVPYVDITTKQDFIDIIKRIKPRRIMSNEENMRKW